MELQRHGVTGKIDGYAVIRFDRQGPRAAVSTARHFDLLDVELDVVLARMLDHRIPDVGFRAFGNGAWLQENSDLTDLRDGLLEQFQALANELGEEQGQPRDIGTRPCKAGDEPACHRIANTDHDGWGSNSLFERS